MIGFSYTCLYLLQSYHWHLVSPVSGLAQPSSVNGQRDLGMVVGMPCTFHFTLNCLTMIDKVFNWVDVFFMKILFLAFPQTCYKLNLHYVWYSCIELVSQLWDV